MKTHLILPDAHILPGQSLERFKWFTKLLFDIKPDVVINIGDFFDMESLCSFDMGHAYFEGRRLKKDLNAGWEAQDLIRDPVIKRKKKRPRFVALEGNHEWRLTRALTKNAVLLDGIVDTGIYGWEDAGWEYYPYDGDTPAIVEVDGVHYTHFLTTAASSNAMSGTNLAASILQKSMKTIVQGHSHILDLSRKVAVDGKPIWGVVVGCYTGGPMRYAGNGSQAWWNGVVVLEGVNNGSFEDIQFISLDTLREEYQ